MLMRRTQISKGYHVYWRITEVARAFMRFVGSCLPSLFPLIQPHVTPFFSLATDDLVIGNRFGSNWRFYRTYPSWRTVEVHPDPGRSPINSD